MPAARDGCAAVEFQGRLVVLGGTNGSKSLDLVHMFDPSSGLGEWQTMPPMTTRRDYCGAAVLGGCMYVFGGSDLGEADSDENDEADGFPEVSGPLNTAE